MLSKEKKELLERFIQGKCSAEEESRVYEWLDQNGSDEEKSHFSESWYRKKEEKIWNILQRNLEGLERSSGYRISLKLIYRYSAVAAFLALVLWSFNRYSGGELWWEGEKYTTAYGEIKEISLNDGSVVTLNAISELKVPRDYGETDRKLFLIGEGYFKVKRDVKKAFLVYSNTITTRALGTEFNVSAYPEDKTTIVSLKKGQVEVQDMTQEQKSQVILNPGEEARVERNHKLEKNSFTEQARLGWKAEYVLFFKDADMEEVLGKLKRHYGVTFNGSALKEKKWKLTGEYKAQSLNDVLESLSFTYNLHYQIKGKEVILLDNN